VDRLRIRSGHKWMIGRDEIEPSTCGLEVIWHQIVTDYNRDTGMLVRGLGLRW
jgi:hypothetical protein